MAVDFYSSLYAADISDERCRKEVLQDLSALTSDQRVSLDRELTFYDVTAAVVELSLCCTPGIEGLPAEFYKNVWTVIGLQSPSVKDAFLAVVSVQS